MFFGRSGGPCARLALSLLVDVVSTWVWVSLARTVRDRFAGAALTPLLGGYPRLFGLSVTARAEDEPGSRQLEGVAERCPATLLATASLLAALIAIGPARNKAPKNARPAPS